MSGPIAGGVIVAVAAIGISIGWVVKHRPRPVPTKPVTASAIFEGPEITLTGALQPQTTEHVDAPVAGIIDAWFVDVGAEVYKDQLVGRIRNAEMEVALEITQAAADRAEVRIGEIDAKAVTVKLEVSRTDADKVRAHNELDRLEKLYQRYKNLYAVGALPRLTFEKTESEYTFAKTEAVNRDAESKDAQYRAEGLDRDSEEAKRALTEKAAALEKAKEAVAQCDLHSPGDGVVFTRDIHQSDKVEAHASVMTIATELTKLAVVLTPEPRVSARIRAGQHAFVSVTGAEIPGEVHEIRGNEVIVFFTSPEPIMKLGTAAQVRIVF
jgi:multidrug efflux pump subunit AcrA (membrane-fusion protein)